MIARINSKTLTKHVPCHCKCKFGDRKCNSNKKWNNDKYCCESNNPNTLKKIMFGILAHALVKLIDTVVKLYDNVSNTVLINLIDKKSNI